MPPWTIFYSWQKDLPNSTNRGLIQKALENAAKAIRDDNSIQVEPVVDRDTQGVSGSPDIGSTIFAKIDKAQAFVCDVSIINRGSDNRLTPNPNVLLELGYAVKTLGFSKIIMVMNRAYGVPEQLPFDLRMKLVLLYNMVEEATERASERRGLERALEENIRLILEGQENTTLGTLIQPPSLGQQAKEAVESQQPNQAAFVRRYMQELAYRINEIAPDLTSEKGDKKPCDRLVEGIASSESLVIEFAHLAEAIAAMNAADSALVVYRGFGPILEGYNNPPGFSGHFSWVQFDFHKFIGHELFVVFFGWLMQEERWELLADLLDQGIYVANGKDGQRATVSYEYVSQPVILLNQVGYLSGIGGGSHTPLLKDRHVNGDLGKASPLDQIIEADCFLYLRSELNIRPAKQGVVGWQPFSALHLTQAPRFMVEARSSKFAEKMLGPLHLDSIEEFRERLKEWRSLPEQPFSDKNIFAPFAFIKPTDIGNDKFPS